VVVDAVVVLRPAPTRRTPELAEFLPQRSSCLLHLQPRQCLQYLQRLRIPPLHQQLAHRLQQDNRVGSSKLAVAADEAVAAECAFASGQLRDLIKLEQRSLQRISLRFST
jgi:hypothetical protein